MTIPKVVKSISDQELIDQENYELFDFWWNGIGKEAWIEFARSNGILIVDNEDEEEVEYLMSQKAHNKFFEGVE